MEQAGTPDELLLKVRSYEPEIAITDIRMPPTHSDEGIRAAKEIRTQFPQVAVLVLSQYVELRYAMELLSDSVDRAGYLLKDRVSESTSFAPPSAGSPKAAQRSTRPSSRSLLACTATTTRLSS